MNDQSLNVDDILAQVRKKRLENEARIRAEQDCEENNEGQTQPEEELEQPGEEPANQKADEENGETAFEEIFSRPDTDSEPEEEKDASEEDDYENISSGADAGQTDYEEPEYSEAPASEKQINIFDFQEESEEPAQKKSKPGKGKKRKLIFRAITAILVILIFIAGGAYLYIDHYLDSITENQGDNSSTSLNEWKGMDVLEESFDPITENPRADISSYKDMVKTWYYNGSPVSSTHVLNVLLIGEDTRDEEIAEEGTRADSAIIVSINIDTQQITLTSVLRDSYAYWELTEGDESSGHFGKINGAMAEGGIDCYIRCVENMFKLNIDNYVIVNFDSFESIVDSLGGVTVELTKAEIREINNHPKRYNYVEIDAQPGTVQLDGRQALAYCRIRKIDSDSVRADRQKTVLLQIFEKMKSASTLKYVDVANKLLPYVKTGFGRNEIISIIRYAINHGWLSFETQTSTIPQNETEHDGSVVTTCKGGTFYGVWCWKVDYPLAAQRTQEKIYGKTNITLAESRPKFSELK